MQQMETVKLNNGITMPMLGLGTFQVTDPETCERNIVEALETGYRLIDTAQAYGNEEYIGRALDHGNVPRRKAVPHHQSMVQELRQCLRIGGSIPAPPADGLPRSCAAALAFR